MSDMRLLANAEEAVDRAHLEAALSSGRKLRVKFGIDPTSPDIHIGHAIPLGTLRAFQDAGHQAVLIIGDFTAMIGDPTGKTAARPALTKEDTACNLETYLAQAGKIIDVSRTEVHRNSEWLSDAMPALITIGGGTTIQQIIQRADFKKRMDGGVGISLLELLYPVFQGYDSVAVRADIEIGGSDQLFNLLMGRHIQKLFGQEPQDIMTLPLIEGIDGTKKMSKSAGNHIAMTDEPETMFGKIMSIPDTLMPKYFRLLTNAPMDIVMQKGVNQRDLKLTLAEAIVSRFHDSAAGKRAAAAFMQTFVNKELPKDAPEWRAPKNPITAIDLVAGAGEVTKSEAKRLITQGGVKLDGATLHDPMAELSIPDGALLQIGKLKAFKIQI